MNKTIKVMVAGAMLSLGVAAHAASTTASSVWVYNATNLYDADDNPISSPITLAAFDTSLGTLQSVQYTIYANISGDLYAENKEAGSRTLTIGGGATLSLSSSGPSFTQDVVTTNSVLLGGYDGSVDFGGTSGTIVHITTPVSVSAVSQVYSSSDASWNPNYFTSNLTFDLTGVAVATGPGNAAYMSDPTVDVQVVATYIYAPVPEPETYGMLLAGLGMMGVVARRKAKKSA